MATETDEPFLHKMFKDEENYNIVLSIREELMVRVMDECYKSYLKKQTPRFIVQCAHDALVKFLSFELYYHPDIPDLNKSVWIADDPIEPSPKDTWSCDAVPIRPSDFKPKESDEIIVRENTTEKLDKRCTCLGHACICLGSREDLSQKLNTSKVKFETKASKQSLTQDSTHESFKMESAQSVLNPTSTSSVNRSAVKVNSQKLKPEKKESQVKTQETQLDVLYNMPPTAAKVSVVKLPPIRVTSNFHTNPITTKKKRY